jgi:hypothetical protein
VSSAGIGLMKPAALQNSICSGKSRITKRKILFPNEKVSFYAPLCYFTSCGSDNMERFRCRASSVSVHVIVESVAHCFNTTLLRLEWRLLARYDVLLCYRRFCQGEVFPS